MLIHVLPATWEQSFILRRWGGDLFGMFSVRRKRCEYLLHHCHPFMGSLQRHALTTHRLSEDVWNHRRRFLAAVASAMDGRTFLSEMGCADASSGPICSDSSNGMGKRKPGRTAGVRDVQRSDKGTPWAIKS